MSHPASVGAVAVVVRGDPDVYDRLVGHPDTHAVVLADADECLTLIRVLAETLIESDTRLHVVAGVERIMEELDVIEMEAEDE